MEGWKGGSGEKVGSGGKIRQIGVKPFSTEARVLLECAGWSFLRA